MKLTVQVDMLTLNYFLVIKDKDGEPTSCLYFKCRGDCYYRKQTHQKKSIGRTQHILFLSRTKI